MRRLYIRIYLALLASLVIFALLAGVTAGLFRLADNRPREPWPETSAEIAERLLPADRDPAALSSELAFWSEHTGFSLALFSPGGALVAKAGSMPDDIERKAGTHTPSNRRFWRAPGGIYGLTLKDGRLLIAAPRKEGFGLIRFLRFPVTFLGLALAVAAGFYPLIRQLMRRLERLEAGVARFGAGDLSARVGMKGHDEIAKLAATFNASADRIENLMRAHKLLLAHASHELRSPLSRLRMAVERLKGGAGGEAAQAEAARSIAELDALVEEILLASRLQAGAATLALEEVDVAGLLAEECAAYGAELTVADHSTSPGSVREASLTLSLSHRGESTPEASTPAVKGAQPAPSPPGERASVRWDAGVSVIDADARLLRRLFRNLLENAAAYGGRTPPEVTLTSPDNEICVTVCDRGPGVSEGEREKIFEPFYRVQGRATPGGAGLGLALVREIAARHGGQVRCLPRDGGGACFEVRLPRHA